jgi:hypothetical protein
VSGGFRGSRREGRRIVAARGLAAAAAVAHRPARRGRPRRASAAWPPVARTSAASSALAATGDNKSVDSSTTLQPQTRFPMHDFAHVSERCPLYHARFPEVRTSPRRRPKPVEGADATPSRSLSADRRVSLRPPRSTREVRGRAGGRGRRAGRRSAGAIRAGSCRRST